MKKIQKQKRNGKGNKWFDFYPYNQSYEIVSNKNDMVRQAL